VSIECAELEGTVGKVISDTSYDERISMVGDILDKQLPMVRKRTTNCVMALGSVETPEYKRLPPSTLFHNRFEDFIMEMAAMEGSARARKGGQPLPVGKLPGRQRPKMQYYDIGNCPWNVHSVAVQKSIFGTILEKNSSSVNVSVDRLKEWETMSRESVSILSHQDHFISAGMKIFEKLYEMTENDEELEPEMVWNVARQGICMMHSAALGVQDMVKNNISQVGEMMMTRRDALLEKMKGKVPPANIEQLRYSALNTPALFDQEAVDKAIEAAGELKSGRVQDQMLRDIGKISKPPEKSFAARKPFRDESKAERGRGQGRGRSRGFGRRGQGRKAFEKKPFSK
jgi:hypothetical protein